MGQTKLYDVRKLLSIYLRQLCYNGIFMLLMYNFLPYDIFLHCSILKAFADDFCLELGRKHFVGTEENGVVMFNNHFLLFLSYLG